MHRRALSASLLVSALLAGCTTTTTGSAAADAFAAQEYRTCTAAADKAAGAVRAFLIAADSDPLRAGNPDTKPITAMYEACQAEPSRGLAHTLLTVNDGFTPTSVLGQGTFNGIVKVLCTVDGVPLDGEGPKVQAVCAGR